MTGHEALKIGKAGDILLFNDGIEGIITYDSLYNKNWIFIALDKTGLFNSKAYDHMNRECIFVNKEKENSMIKVHYLKKEETKEQLTAQDMKVGDVAIVYNKNYGHVLTLCVYDKNETKGFVDLANPENTWDNGYNEPIVRMVDIEINVLN